jgi:hypothetical protein
MRADWLLNEDTGLEFLREMLKQQRMELFMTRYIMMIIQFLYNKYSYEIKRKLLPVYVIHIISVLLMIIFTEQYRDIAKAYKDEDIDPNDSNHDDHGAGRAKSIKLIF